MNEARIKLIESLLSENFSPSFLEIIDDSRHHEGHAGAKNGAGHFNIKICSDAFVDNTLIQQHRLVYKALDSMMHSEIHALSIETLLPQK